MESKNNSTASKYLIFSSKQWIFIVIVMIGTICFQFIYDIPGSLQDGIMKTYHMSDYQFSLLYSLYALPAAVSTMIGGYLIDGFFGAKWTTILFCTISVLGQALFVLGVCDYSLWQMVAGRIIFGLGSEAADTLSSNYYIFTLFRNGHTNLIFSIYDNLSYVGTIAVYQTSNRLKEYLKNIYHLDSGQAVGRVLIIDSCVIIVGFFCFIIIAFLMNNNSQETSKETVEKDNYSVESQNQLPLSNETTNQNDHDNEPIQPKEEQTKTVKWFDFIQFPASYWLLCVAYACVCNAVFTFEEFSQQTFTESFSYSVNEANDAVSALNITKIALSIPFSMIVDWLGRNCFFLILSIMLSILAHICLLFHGSPYVCLIMLGLSYSLIASTIWPMFLYPLKEIHYGLGTGMSVGITDFVAFVLPIIAGKIIDNCGLFWMLVFFLGLHVFGLIAVIIIWIIDRRKDGVLNMTPQQRKCYYGKSDNT